MKGDYFKNLKVPEFLKEVFRLQREFELRQKEKANEKTKTQDES